MSIKSTTLGLAAAITAIAGIAGQANAGPNCNTGARYAKAPAKPAVQRTAQASKPAPAAQVVAAPAATAQPVKKVVQQAEAPAPVVQEAPTPAKITADAGGYEPVSAVAARLAALAAQAAAAAAAGARGSGE